MLCFYVASLVKKSHPFIIISLLWKWNELNKTEFEISNSISIELIILGHLQNCWREFKAYISATTLLNVDDTIFLNTYSQ